MKKGLLIAGSSFLLVGLAFGAANASTLNQKIKGKILLQVESKGEAWYVNPASGERNSLGRPSEAFEVMKSAGVGITNANLKKIQVADKNLASGKDTDGDGLSDTIEISFGTDASSTDSDSDGTDDKTEILAGYDPTSSDTASMIDADFAAEQSGKILLQVESKGEAWYVNPTDNKRYFLGRPADAFNVMRSVGLGISNDNLDKVKVHGRNASSTVATSTDMKKGDKGEKGKFKIGTGTPPTMEGAATSTDMMRADGGQRGRGGMDQHNGLFATVTTVDDSSLIVTSQKMGSSTEAAEIYTVTLNSSTVYMKDRATSTIDDITIGSKVMIEGNIDATAKTVAATKIDVMTKAPEMPNGENK
jgi:hypothetical protein